VQLDPVRSDAGLPVQVIEEGDAADTRPSAEAGHPPRPLICLRPEAVAPLVQSGEGVSAIIVLEPLRRTRW
jgi:hypothetical protein